LEIWTFLGIKIIIGALNDGHNAEYVLISLNKKISPKHLKQLEDALCIEEDIGTELAFA